MRTYVSVRGGRVSEVAADVVREQPLTIHVNGEKFLTLLCSPMMLEALVVGYLWMEKVIGDVERSEEHTSELQSRLHLVCRLLLEKKKREPVHQQVASAPSRSYAVQSDSV